MNLQPGDYVVHPAYGVGTIQTIEEMKVAEQGPALFYRVGFDKTTVWVSLQLEAIKMIRPITPRGDLPRYRAILKSSPVLLSDDFRSRHGELENRYKENSFTLLCEIVRDLDARSRAKSLNSFESTLLKKAHHFLVQEWAITDGTSNDEAAHEIDALIRDRR